jgi:virulence-associated protein VapD
MEEILLSRWDIENIQGSVYLAVKRICLSEVFPTTLHRRVEQLPVMANYIIYFIYSGH